MNLATGTNIFMGSVVNIYDPLLVNRVQVRLFGLHESPKTDLPNDDLIWALVLMPNTGSSMTGLGHSTHGLKQGAIVAVQFLDGPDEQIPMVIGSIHGIQCEELPELFKDPAGQFPIKDRMCEPDVNRLARNQKIGETIVPKKDQTGGVDHVTGSWSMPPEPYNAKYTFNRVEETISGHVIEKDDTPGAERLLVWHRTGTYTEFHPNGDVVHRGVNNEYIHIKANMNIYVEGTCNLTVKGDLNNRVYGNENRHITGNLTEQIDGNFTQTVSGKIETQAGSSISNSAGSSISNSAGSSITNNASGSFTNSAGGSFTVSAPSISLN